RNARRLTCGDAIMVITPSSRPGRRVNCLAYLLIGAAAADVRDSAVDIGIARLGVLLKQGGDRHDHPALAITALRYIVINPGLLYLVQGAVGGEALDSDDLLGADRADRDRTGAGRDTIEMHGASAALGDAAAVFRAGQAD